MNHLIDNQAGDRAGARLNGWLRDLACGLKQQMYFWGRDVLHPSGNLLIRQGFSKRPSAGLQSTSCYALERAGGTIELHGACAGWYSGSSGREGFVYIRPKGKCVVWKGGGAPVPGEWPQEWIEPIRDAPPDACRRFLDWWLESEAWVKRFAGEHYRTECHRAHKRLPKSKAWLSPAAAGAWLEASRQDPSNLVRSKSFMSRNGGGG